MDYVIKNGTVCLEGEHFRADVTVRDGKIQALGQAVHSGHEQVIDADGLYVCPGGIDAHTHMDLQQSPQYRACDDFYSGGLRRHDDHPGPHGLWPGGLFPALSF